MLDFRVWWDEFLQGHPGVYTILLASALILIAYVLLRMLVKKLVRRRVADSSKRYYILLAVEYVLGAVAFVALVTIWFRDQVNVGTFLGLATAGLAIALNQPITNLAGWLFIVTRQPFKVGDRIQIAKEVAGDVIDIRLFMTSLLEVGNWVDADQSTGRIVHVPNSAVFSSPIANYTQGFPYIWNEIPVTVTFESDWKRAKEVLDDVAKEHVEPVAARAAETIREGADRHRYMIQFQHLTPIVYIKVVDIGVTLTLRYLCETRQRRQSETKLWVAILDAYAKESTVDFAYPTQRFYDNVREGKPGAGGSPKAGSTEAGSDP
jgi:small-conductance mechanosensitive channel